MTMANSFEKKNDTPNAHARSFAVHVRFDVPDAGDDEGARHMVEMMLRVLENHPSPVTWQVQQTTPSDQ